jgi:hypothetical protein
MLICQSYSRYVPNTASALTHHLPITPGYPTLEEVEQWKNVCSSSSNIQCWPLQKAVHPAFTILLLNFCFFVWAGFALGFFSSYVLALGWVCFLVWAVFLFALGWGKRFFVSSASWSYVGWDRMRMRKHVGLLLFGLCVGADGLEFYVKETPTTELLEFIFLGNSRRVAA